VGIEGSHQTALKDPSFTIYATASRIDKGLLAIPRRFSAQFPQTKQTVLVIFDDGTRAERKIYVPYDPKIKECRVFGLSRWFSRRGVVPGDAITVTVVDAAKGIYRIALDRFIRQRRAVEARRKLYMTDSAEVAGDQLRRLAEAKQEQVREIAFQEIVFMAKQPVLRRKRRTVLNKGRAEAVPPALRASLEVIHQGRCQICRFTFKKRDGSPYFEIHHLEANKGHHPTNVLVVCPNCHAQFENATITEMDRIMGWLVGVTINGRRIRVRQPFVRGCFPDVVATIIAVCIAARAAGNLVC
jgi:hypothetical protein